MSRFFYAIIAIFAFAAFITEAYIDCCTNSEACNRICTSQNCGFTLCCHEGCTGPIGNQNIPPCACSCGGCANPKLSASGLLGGSKFAKVPPAMFIEDGTAIYKLNQ